MAPNHGFMPRGAFALAILCTGMLVFNMVAIPVYKDQVFLQRGTLNPGVEMVILIGFALVLLFNIVSLSWVSRRIRQAQGVRKGEWGVLALGALCLILMAGEKVMVDEIGREYLLGWEVLGEWIILYAFLAIQLVYNVVILSLVYRSFMARRGKARA
jgi:hypothetical protein